VVSSISAMNVDTPRSWLSPAPTRHKIASATQMSAKVQGTKQPICAIKMATPICALDQRVDAPTNVAFSRCRCERTERM